MSSLITRERHKVNCVEKSIIGFVLVSDDIVEHIVKIVIADERRHVLTIMTKTKGGVKNPAYGRHQLS